jgi:hypothetical protein
MRARLPIILTIALFATALPATAAAAEAPWTPVTPELSPQATLGLFDVTAVSPTDVWVLGHSWSNPEQPLVAHWTGDGWRAGEAPVVPDFQYGFLAVDAVSARDVWAVGNGVTMSDHVPAPVVGHYDGATWSVASVPTPSNSDVLTDIDMTSATNGWAVGWRYGATDLMPLVMRWRNGRWATMSLPPVGDGSALLEHVHARAGNDVWAVGSQGDSALVMHFDGTRWSRVEVPDSGAADARDTLSSVTAVSAGEVWAVGDSCVWGWNGNECQPLILRLSGGAWQEVPPAGDHGTNLRDVVARASDDVWGIGYDALPSGEESNHVEHWDGQRFTTVPAKGGSFAARSGLASALEAVTRIPGTAELWAVGWQDTIPQVIRHG